MRDAQRTRREILAAATAEFGRSGFSGARIDKIAAASGFNKALIYSYFGNKEALFFEVVETQLSELIASVPLVVEDLPEYAARLYEFNAEHPELARLVQWYQLEQLESAAIERLLMDTSASKVAEIKAAQEAGTIGTRLSAEEVLATIHALSVAWVDEVQTGSARAARRIRKQRRETIVSVVSLVVAR